MKMKMMIVAGGTGGHIYPALALADIFVKQSEENEVVFFGSDNRLESHIIPEHGYRFIGVSMVSTQGGITTKIRSLFSLIKAENFAKKILLKEKPEVCVGFGNYTSVPFIRAAHKLGIPTVLHEQNSYAGKANMYLGRIADAVVGCYSANLEQFPEDKVHLYGNPEATLALKTECTADDLKQYGLNPDKPFVLMMMGSLGSASVSEVLDEACPLLDDSYQVIIATGKSNSYQFCYRSNERIKIVEYVDGKKLLKGCRLAVVRAGATTIAELCAIGTASILIPSPYVPNNHQYYNALELSKEGAGALIEEKDLTAKKLADTVNGLMKDSDRLEKMKKNAKKLGRTDAAEKMIALCKELSR